jgi:hypothetical protein
MGMGALWRELSHERRLVGLNTGSADGPYGVRNLSVKDPDGHILAFATRLANFDEAPGRTR